MSHLPSPEPPPQEDTLTIGQLADYLGWSARLVEGLIRGEHLPASQIDGQWRFRREEVVHWLQQKIRNLDSVQVSELDGGLEGSLLASGAYVSERGDRLGSRLHPAGIELDVPAYSKSGVLRSLVNLAEATGLLTDRDALHTSLLDRESLCSTAVGDGVAFVHPRRPLPQAIRREFLCFLRTCSPVDFGAENGAGSTLFFLLCARDERSHLHAMARLARILQAGGLELARSASSASEFKEAFTAIEQSIPPTR